MLFLDKIRTVLESWSRSHRLRHRAQRVFILGIFVNLLFGQLFYLAESGVQEELTFGDSIWWTFVTATTVGYGDFYPRTNIGRFLVALPLMLIGIGIVGSMIGLITEAVIDFGNRKRKGIMKVKCTNHVIVCNYPGHQKLMAIATELRAVKEYEQAEIVLITESFDALPPELSNTGITFVRGNSTQEEVLERANLAESLGVIILAKDSTDIRCDDRSFAIATVIENLVSQSGYKATTTVELVSPRNFKMMRKSGVGRIVFDSGHRQQSARPGIPARGHAEYILRTGQQCRGASFHRCARDQRQEPHGLSETHAGERQQLPGCWHRSFPDP
jgi:voltage-gated potassium channel